MAAVDRAERVITVAGEALIDVIIDRDNGVSLFPGGAPFNVARTVARLGAPCQFLGRTGDDALGRRLRAALEESGVQLAVPTPAAAPTTLAVAEVDEDGSATYRFYIEGTAAPQLRLEEIPARAWPATTALVLGGLGIVAEPIASTLLSLLAAIADDVTVLLDPNCRPQSLPAGASYATRLRAFLPRADIVKASTDDLRLIAPGSDARDTARALLHEGPTAVLVTDGPGAVSVHTVAGENTIPVPEVDVVDTVGAGDAFVAGFITWCRQRGVGRTQLSDHDLVCSAARAAVAVAAAACTVAGANLPETFSWTEGEVDPAV